VIAANQVNRPVIDTDLYLIDLATRVITPMGIRHAGGLLYDVTWSPDGTKLAFVSDHLDNRLALFVWDLTKPDNRPRILTDKRFSSVAEPDWSPDSTRLAFIGFTLQRETALYVIDDAGTNLHTLPTATGYVWSPRWRPDDR
jgi:Tol biopolymer transport system component